MISLRKQYLSILNRWLPNSNIKRTGILIRRSSVCNKSLIYWQNYMRGMLLNKKAQLQRQVHLQIIVERNQHKRFNQEKRITLKETDLLDMSKMRTQIKRMMDSYQKPKKLKKLKNNSMMQIQLSILRLWRKNSTEARKNMVKQKLSDLLHQENSITNQWYKFNMKSRRFLIM